MKKTEEIGSIYNPYNLIDNPTVYKGGIIIQGVELLPIKKYGIRVPDYYISKRGQLWSMKKMDWRVKVNNFRDKADKNPKNQSINLSTLGQPFWDAGHNFKRKRPNGNTIEIKMAVHHMVKLTWHPFEHYSHEVGISKEAWDSSHPEIKKFIYEQISVDHDDDNPMNNDLNNLFYTTSLRNSNYRKLWRKNVA